MTPLALGIHSTPIRRLLGMPPHPPSNPGGRLHHNKVAPAPAILPPRSGPKTLAKTTKEAVDRYPTVYALAARTKAAYTLRPKHPDPFRKTWDALNPTEPLEMKRLLKAVETEEARLLKATFYEVAGNSESLRESPEYKGLQAARELGLGVHPSAQKSIDQVMTPGNMGETPGFNVFNERNIRIWDTAVTAHKRVYRDIATETQAIVAAARRELAATRDRLMWLNPRMRDELTVQIKAFTKATEAITTDINRKPFQNLKTARKRREELNAAVATWMIADSKNADALDAANGVLNALNIVSRPGFVRLTFDNPQKRVIIHDTNSGVPRRAAQLREVLDTVRKIKQSPAPTDKELTLLRKSLAELPRLSANLKREADKLRNALATEPTFSGAQKCMDRILNPGDIGQKTLPENFEAVLRQIQALTHAVTQPEKGMTETEIRTLENFHAVLHAGLPLLSPRRMLSGPREAGESHDAWATLKKIGQTHPSQITDAQLRQLRDIRTKHLELSDTLYTTAMTAIQNNSRLFLNAHKERHAWRQLMTGVSPRAKAESDQALATAAMGEDLRPEMLPSADIRAMQNTRPYTDVSDEIAEEITAIRISARTMFQTTQAKLTDLSPETQTQFRDQIRSFTRAMARLKTTQTLESFQAAWACCQACHASALKSLSTVSAPDPTPPLQDVPDTYPRPSAQRRDVMRATARRERIRHIREQQQTIAQALDDSPYFDGHTGSRKSMDSLTAHYDAQIQSFLAVLRSKDLPTEPISERTLDAITNTQREALEAATAAAKYLATITSERQADMRKSFAQLRGSGRRPSRQAVALSVRDAARRMWAELAQQRQLSSDDYEI